MELYIEKEFLDNFYLDYNESKLSEGQKVIASILTEYGEVKWYLDESINSEEDLENLKMSNPFIGLRISGFTPPIFVQDFKRHIVENSECHQTIVMTSERKEWFKEIQNKGVLCFSFLDYKERIEDIVQSCHFKIDLSEDFGGWGIFNFFNKIPLNKVLINDNYILKDRNNEIMEQNIVPLLLQILHEKGNKVIIDIYTKDMAPLSDQNGHIKEAAKKRYNFLNLKLANHQKKIRIFKNDLRPGNFDFHDRIILTNFLSVDSGRGFNIIPHVRSNSQILITSIFEKYTYNRIKNQFRMYKDYILGFEKGNTETCKFLKYPN